ncbi:MAG: DUF4037 domain-containing protein [Clostridiaceae bacterium]|nr:DUF4037 domain-containing protein [Clostridiaceae bacterium]
MPAFIPGKQLCASYFFEIAKPILDESFQELHYTAGLLGYGSDVLGYDDAVSRDHMWGPRFYLFLRQEEKALEPEIRRVFAARLPYTYQGYSVNFSAPDPEDHGVRHPERIDHGEVNPLLFIQTVPEYLQERLGLSDLNRLTAADWLSFSEHRLLSLASAQFYVDGLGMQQVLEPLKQYPRDVRLYLIASCWDAIACEQAFAKRCGAYGDELGSRLICARIAERLMRLCFLYLDTYAPYSKWFGTAFDRLPLDPALRDAIHAAVSADTVAEREDRLVRAQLLTAGLHNASGLSEPVDVRIESYFGRDIRVIYADRLAEAAAEALRGTELEGVPLMGSLSQIGGLSTVSDDVSCRKRVRRFYEKN